MIGAKAPLSSEVFSDLQPTPKLMRSLGFSVHIQAQLAEGVTINDPPLLIEVNPGKQAVVAGAADHITELGFAAGEVDPFEGSVACSLQS